MEGIGGEGLGMSELCQMLNTGNTWWGDSVILVVYSYDSIGHPVWERCRGNELYSHVEVFVFHTWKKRQHS